MTPIMRARLHRLWIPLAALAAAAALTGLAAAAETPWPFDPPPINLRQSPRKVFAHYFTPFPISLDNKEPEAGDRGRREGGPEGGARGGDVVQGPARLRPPRLPAPARRTRVGRAQERL